MTEKHIHNGFLSYAKEEFPAFHAGFLVTLLVLSTLLNLGDFALLLAAAVTMRTVRSGGKMLPILRGSLTDLLLFALLFLLTLTTSGGPVFWIELLRGGGFLLLKGVLILRIVPFLFGEEENVETGTAITPSEQLSFVFLLVLLFLIGLSPAVIPGGWKTLLSVLRMQLPWKL